MWSPSIWLLLDDIREDFDPPPVNKEEGNEEEGESPDGVNSPGPAYCLFAFVIFGFDFFSGGLS